MYYQIQKADRPAIRDTDHPFSVPNHKRTRKTDQPQLQKKIATFTVYMHQLRDQRLLDPLRGPDPELAESTKVANAGWIHCAQIGSRKGLALVRYIIQC